MCILLVCVDAIRKTKRPSGIYIVVSYNINIIISISICPVLHLSTCQTVVQLHMLKVLVVVFFPSIAVEPLGGRELE